LKAIVAIFFNGILPVVILCCLSIPIQPFKKKITGEISPKKEKLKTKKIRKKK
jgi:hypothetical protein